MSYLLERDGINGKQGTAFLTINGQNIEMFGVRKLETSAEFSEADFKVVGTIVTQKKTTGVTYTGTMNVYYGTPHFLRLLQEYKKTGKLPYFTLQVTNNDPSSTLGTQTVVLYNVKLQKLPIAKLDSDSDYLDMEVGFSFTDFEVLQYFADAPEQLGND